jgi:hypothetical protein
MLLCPEVILQPSHFEQCHLRAIVPRRTATMTIKSAAPINGFAVFPPGCPGKETPPAVPVDNKN